MNSCSEQPFTTYAAMSRQCSEQARQSALTLEISPTDSLAIPGPNIISQRGELHRRTDVLTLTPVSWLLAIVLEHIPLHASQNRISWSYEPVTSITDMSWRDALDLEEVKLVGAGISARWVGELR